MYNRRAAFLYFFMKGILSLSISMLLTIELVYLATIVGLNALHLVLIGTVAQIVSFLFQTPTGILADMYSRRWSVVFGIFLIGLAYLLEGLIPLLLVVFLIQPVRGLGMTLLDGADTAWISDEVGVDRANSIFIRAAQISSFCSLLGIAISIVLVNFSLNLPVALGGGLIVGLSIILALFMPEENFKPIPREDRNPWQQMGYTLLLGVRTIQARPVLLAIVSIAVFAGVFSAGFDQLWQYHLLHNVTFPALGGLTTAVWFGIIEACIVVTNFIGVEIVRRSVNVKSHRAVAIALLVSDTLAVVSILGFALTGEFMFALMAFFLYTTVGGPRIPLEQVWMNQNSDSSVRATVFSLRGQVNSIAQIIGGPIIGVIALTFSTQTALIVAAIVLSPSLLFYLRSLRRSGPDMPSLDR